MTEPGTAITRHDGILGIAARVPPHPGVPDQGVGVVYGPHTLFVKAAEDVRKNWHAVAFPDGSIGGRKPGARGRRGYRTIPGASWLDDVKRGDVGRVNNRGSGPRGGRPR